MYNLFKSGRDAVGPFLSNRNERPKAGFGERLRQRQVLRHLGPHLLDDIGMTEAERAREVRRIF